MKKIIPLFVVALLSLLFVSCDNDNDRESYVDNDTYPVVYDATTSFVYRSGSESGYYQYYDFASQLKSSTILMIYRQVGTADGKPVWQQIPKTEYLSNSREIDYNFQYNVNSAKIYLEANFDMANLTDDEKTYYLNNQTFRLVLVPASRGTQRVDLSTYENVIKYYNIDDSNPQRLN